MEFNFHQCRRRCGRALVIVIMMLLLVVFCANIERGGGSFDFFWSREV